MSPVKEPTFFCSYFQVVKNPVSYFNLFASDRRYRVDASHAYLSNPETPPIIKALFPDAKFLLILRAPDKRAHSLYKHMRRPRAGGQPPFEPLADFERALATENERFASPDFLRDCPQYFWNFMYCRSSYYDEQIARYFALFDRSRFHVLSLAELANRPVPSGHAIAQFLEIDPAPLKSNADKAFNMSADHQPVSEAAASIMRSAFAGLTARVDRLIGQELDWSR